MIDEEIASPIGESKSYFINNWSVPVKVSLSNTGTESFLYKIQNIDKGTNVINGVLKSSENFEQVFDRLPEGTSLNNKKRIDTSFINHRTGA